MASTDTLTNGDGSAIQNNNGNRCLRSLRDDLIEALRGLTIKMELKISDVVSSVDVNASNGNHFISPPMADELKNWRPPKSDPVIENVHIKQEVAGPVNISLPRSVLEPNVKTEIGQEIAQPPLERQSEKPVEKPQDPPRRTVRVSQIIPRQVLLAASKPVTRNGDASSRATKPTSLPEVKLDSVKEALPSKIVSPGQQATPNTLPKAADHTELQDSGHNGTKPAFVWAQSSQDETKLAEVSGRLDWRTPKSVSPVQRVEPIADPTLADRSPPVVPTMFRGKLKVGSIIPTCYLSGDTTVEPVIIYITSSTHMQLELTQKLKNLAQEIQALPNRSVKSRDIVFYKSPSDGSWYRAITREISGSDVDVYALDWGTIESVKMADLRPLDNHELDLTNYPALAVKAKFTNKLDEKLDATFDNAFNVRIDSFDDFDEIYTVTAQL